MEWLEQPLLVIGGEGSDYKIFIYNMETSTKILFIGGFDSQIDGGKRYKPIEDYINNSGYIFESFYYSANENVEKVYKELKDKLNNEIYKNIIAHSFGSALLMRFCTENFQETGGKDISCICSRIIFLMPLLTDDNRVLSNISKIPLIELAQFPRFLFTSSRFSNDYRLANISQIKNVYNDWLKKFNMSLLKQDYYRVLYARDELIFAMSPKNLGQIPDKNKKIISIGGDIWNNSFTKSRFLKILKGWLLSIKPLGPEGLS